MDRRAFLASGAAVTMVGVAGCLGDDDGDEEEPTAEIKGSFRTIWRTDRSGETDDDQIRLPLLDAGTYDFDVEWGDGTADSIQYHDDTAVTHTYDEPGEYEVSIEGTLDGWSFVDELTPGRGLPVTDAPKLLEIREWDDFDIGIAGSEASHIRPDLRVDFVGAENLSITAADTPNLWDGASLAWLFFETGITGGVSDWDVSNVEDMERMFSGAVSFDGDVSDWDVSSVRDMSWMFAGAQSFDGDVSDWDVSNVTDMSFMFDRAESFNGDVSDWDVSNVTDMRYTFAGAESFSGDVSNWDVSTVTDMQSMFTLAESFEGDVSGWDVAHVTDKSQKFARAQSFVEDLSGWDVSNVTDMDMMFEQAEYSTANYDALLVAWQDLDLEAGVRFSVGETQYNPGDPAEARQHIIDEYGWDISDGGMAE